MCEEIINSNVPTPITHVQRGNPSFSATITNRTPLKGENVFLVLAARVLHNKSQWRSGNNIRYDASSNQRRAIMTYNFMRLPNQLITRTRGLHGHNDSCVIVS